MITCMLLSKVGTDLVIGTVMVNVLFWSDFWRRVGELTATARLATAAVMEPLDDPSSADLGNEVVLPISLPMVREKRRLAAHAAS